MDLYDDQVVSVFTLRCIADFRYVFAVLQAVTAITVVTVVVGSACVCLFFFILLRTRNSFGFILDDYTKRGVDMAISSADT